MKISIYIANKKYKYLSSYKKVQYIDDMDREYETKTITSNKILEYINLYEINKERLSYYNNKIILLWIGERNELNNLKKILPNLDLLAKKLKYQKLILKVICD